MLFIHDPSKHEFENNLPRFPDKANRMLENDRISSMFGDLILSGDGLYVVVIRSNFSCIVD